MSVINTSKVKFYVVDRYIQINKLWIFLSMLVNRLERVTRLKYYKQTLENTEGTINNGQSRETGNIYRVHKTKKNKTKNTPQYVLDTTMRKQIQITCIRHEPSYKQLEVKTLEKTECAINNGQSRETGNIVHTRHRTKTNKTTIKNTTQKAKKMINTESTKNRG